MGWFTTLFGGSADPIASIGGIMDELVTTDEERMAADTLMERVKNKPRLAAIALNTAQAQHKNWFVAGGRPALLWVAASGLFMFYVPQYTMAAILWTRLSWSAQEILPYPVTADGLLELVALAIGMGTIRHLGKKDGHDQ